jgi:hypothetical protein
MKFKRLKAEQQQQKGSSIRKAPAGASQPPTLLHEMRTGSSQMLIHRVGVAHRLIHVTRK